jgi:hypothetical protein
VHVLPEGRKGHPRHLIQKARLDARSGLLGPLPTSVKVDLDEIGHFRLQMAGFVKINVCNDREPSYVKWV